MAYSIDDLQNAIKRIALSRDGELLHIYLQKRILAVGGSNDPGALQTDHGERKFAHQLKALMDSAIVESKSARREKASGSERVIVTGQPGIVREHRRSRRRGGLE